MRRNIYILNTLVIKSSPKYYIIETFFNKEKILIIKLIF